MPLCLQYLCLEACVAFQWQFQTRFGTGKIGRVSMVNGQAISLLMLSFLYAQILGRREISYALYPGAFYLLRSLHNVLVVLKLPVGSVEASGYIY